MKKTSLILSSLVLSSALLFTACSGGGATSTDTTEAEATSAEANVEDSQADSSDAETETGAVDAETVTITDIHGEVEVPVNPEVVISLDNRTFETLEDWGIELAAAPKDVMSAESSYVSDDSVVNIGDHREPNLEALAAADPDLVIVGQRFVSYYDEIKALVPDAVVIDFSFDVSESENTGENLVNGLKDATTALGQIFDKNEEAEELCNALDEAISGVLETYNGTDTIMSVVVSGGEIGYSAPGNGRVWGPLYQVFAWVPAIDVENTTSDHQGDDISIEAIADSNPDWIMVLDRDVAVQSEEGAQTAADVIENAPALQNLTAITENRIVYAPNDTYTTESIQTYLEILSSIKEAFENANN